MLPAADLHYLTGALGQDAGRPGTTIQFIIQPVRAMAAQTINAMSKLPIATASPPIRDPSEIPRKSALLFQASTWPRLPGKSLARPDCWAGKNNCATAALNPTTRSTKTPVWSATSSKQKQIERPARLTPAVYFAPSRSARRPPIRAPAIAPTPKTTTARAISDLENPNP